MALIDELKQQRAEIDEKYHRAIADECYFSGRLHDLDRAIAALEAPAQPVHPEAELRDAPPAASEESRDQSEDFTLLDSAVLRDEPEIPEGWMPVTSDDCPADPHSLVEVIAKHGLITYATQPVVAGEVMWEFQRAYRIVKPAPLIDAQTCEEIDPRVSWKAEPEIPDGFTKWEGGNDPVTTEDSEGYMDGPIVEVIYRDGVRTEGPSWTYIWSHEYSDSSQHIIAYRIITPKAEPEPEGYAPVVDAEPVLDATELAQVTIDKVPPTAEVIKDQNGRAKFALFGGQTHEVVEPSNTEADFWARALFPKKKEQA